MNSSQLFDSLHENDDNLLSSHFFDNQHSASEGEEEGS